MSDITDAMETNAAGPAKVTVDGESVEQHSLKDLIEADRYLASRTAVTSTAANTRRGLRFNKLTPPGTV